MKSLRCSRYSSFRPTGNPAPAPWRVKAPKAETETADGKGLYYKGIKLVYDELFITGDQSEKKLP